MNTSLENIIPPKLQMTDADFKQISSYITANYGIKLPDFKKTMVEGRLQKRLRIKGIDSFKEYIELVFSEKGKSELLEMIDAISTNKTDFYRESAHFEFMRNRLLPEFNTNSFREKLKIWSSAASSGEEIYTIAFVIEEYLDSIGRTFDYSIVGTDISVDKLKAAVNAVYPVDRINDIPLEVRNKYLLKSKDSEKKTVRVIPAIRNKTRFLRLNLMDRTYNMDSGFDIIFCRNVLIYFDKDTQECVINKLCEKLKPGGHFFLGHSESIIGKQVPLKQIIPTVYVKI